MSLRHFRLKPQSTEDAPSGPQISLVNWPREAVLRFCCAVAGVAIATSPATAQTWSYVQDSASDGTEGQTIGQDSAFEFFGAAYREQGDRLTFAFSSNLAPDQGFADSSVLNGAISYGDLMLNFGSGGSFAATDSSQLYGIRFDSSNDSGVELGLYSNVTPESLTLSNNGYASFSAYEAAVTSLGGSPSLGGMERSRYFADQEAPPTHIATGVRLGDVAAASIAELEDLDFSGAGIPEGEYVFGVTVARSLLPDGDFIAHFLAECANDAVAFAGELSPTDTAGNSESPMAVPESGRTGLLLSFASLSILLQQHRSRSN